MKLVAFFYRKFLIKRPFYVTNTKLFNLILRGIGILNYEGFSMSGEAWFQEFLSSKLHPKVIIDVGANFDPYGLDLPMSTQIYAFEPNKRAFMKLRKNVKGHRNIHCFQQGLSNKPGKAFIYDISDEGTALSSLNREAVTKIYGSKPVKTSVDLTTLDLFVQKHSIESIDLLKIDTEGHEYKVLIGAKKTLAANKIKIILFEFNEMNVYTRVFMKDFYDLLKNFSFFRLMPDGLLPLGEYSPIRYELFAYQNIVAVKKDIPLV